MTTTNAANSSPITAESAANSLTTAADVAAYIERKADDYAREHGVDDMGSLSFGNDAMRDYHWGLLELADEIRKLAAPRQPGEKSHLHRWSEVIKQLPVSPQPGEMGAGVEADIPEAIRLLGLMFDGYENGISCNEDGDGAYLGQAFRLSEEDFGAIADLLNRRNPPRFDVRANGLVVAASAQQDEREAFEAWLQPYWSRETYTDPDGDRLYRENWVQGAWIAWQARTGSQQ